MKKYQNKIQRQKARTQQQSEYHKRASRMISFRFMIARDKEVIEKISSQPNKTDYIRRLVEQDIEVNGK